MPGKCPHITLVICTFDLQHLFLSSLNITHNYSQCYQDLFVLSVLEGKTNGTYVEIGSGDPFVSNNTALLEQFGWTGISLEVQESLVDKFNASRKNLVACGDATEVDYDELFTEIGFANTDFDYLQVDCEPSSVTFAALKKIPHDISIGLLSLLLSTIVIMMVLLSVMSQESS